MSILGKIRVYELAKKLGVSSKKLIEVLEDLNVEIRNHMSTLDDETAELIYEMLSEEKKERNKDDTKKTKEYKTQEEIRVENKIKDKNKKGDKRIIIPDKISIKDLGEKINIEPSKIIKELFEEGIIATINQQISKKDASRIAKKYGFEVVLQDDKEIDNTIDTIDINDIEDQEEEENFVNRPPIVTVMGHVDHGKTSLLDAIRKANVTASEAGGITQHIGAYQVTINGKKIVFLDTPGHEAFTEMRARGAKVTDVAVLVVAADDGVMPQTIEAINHAKAANIPIIVAINKIDKPNANPDRVKQQLSEYGLIPEDWGGDTVCVPVSAINKKGINTLLEMILLVAEMCELKANPKTNAVGTIIEAKLDKGRGPVATVIVQKGTLYIGDAIVAGTAYGRVRAMIDDKGKRLKEAGPSVPVEVLGLSDVPNAGDLLYTVKDEKLARQIAEKRKEKQKESELKQANQKVTLDKLFQKIQKGEVKELNIIIKGDVQGSVEALIRALEKLSYDKVKVKVIHGAVGSVTESDVMLASASNAIIIGFNVRPEPNAKKIAEKEKVDIRTYRVIYNVIDDIELAMKGMLEPSFREAVIGRAEVRATFKVPGVGIVAGCYVLEGQITRNSLIRVIRDGIIVYEGKLDSLKRFKDDVKEVNEGYECGIGLEKFNDIKEGDILEAVITEKVTK